MIMRAFIHSDSKGNIVSVTKVRVMAEGLEHPFAQVAESDHVTEVSLTNELEQLLCHEICERFTVDTANSALKPKPPPN